MPGATRVTDRTKGVCNLGLPCCPHGRSGVNERGSNDTIINDLKAHRVTDTGPTLCPHGGTFKSTEGSPDVYVNDLKQTRLGDITPCIVCGMKGKHSTCSPDVIINS